MTPFAEALLAAPLGVTTLAEFAQRGMAANEIATLPVEQFLSTALDVSAFATGSFDPSARENVAIAYGTAGELRPIADAVAARFGDVLHRPFDPVTQQWWTTPVRTIETRGAWFIDLDWVYCCGEFPWNGLWTVTDPPAEIHDKLVEVWEFDPHPTSRWQMPIDVGARVLELHRPEDWDRLARRFPIDASGRHHAWELPGRNQPIDGLQALLDVPGQHAVAVGGSHLCPDWAAVAGAYDVVHLSWAGWLTSDGFVSQAVDESTTMLRYWNSERSLWLRDCFGAPTPLDPPQRCD